MTFNVTWASDYHRNEVVDIDTLADLFQFIDKVGSNIVVNPAETIGTRKERPCITVYDDYME